MNRPCYGIIKVLDVKLLVPLFTRSMPIVNQSFIFLSFQVLDEFKNYSFPADIWSLGALISFFCNGEHLFCHPGVIQLWSKTNVLPDHYSKDLKNLVASMLDPYPKNRPSAGNIDEETLKNDRQKVKIL